MNSNPYILVQAHSRKIFLIPSFSFFWISSYDSIVYAYFTYAATSSALIDDATKLVMHRILNTNLILFDSSFTYNFERKI